MKFVFASNNENKLREYRSMLKPLNVTIVSQKELGLDIDVDETGETFEENAYLKAAAIMNATGLATIADDSGLMVDALDGAPGVYSHRFGNQPDDTARCRYLLEQLKDVSDTKRTAKFVTVIVCLFPDGKKIVARGECCGAILRDLRGENGFGYDPVFYTSVFDKTFAELTMNEKNSISHRGKALRAFYAKLEEQLNHDDK